MSDDVYGRQNYIDIIRKYAESSIVGNQAFLGVKGVGKTALFQSYFTRKKRGELAQEYKNLFVFSQLDSRKQGSDLYKFLIDQVKMAVMSIPDKDVKEEIKTEMGEIDEIFETPDGRLNQYLTIIKETGYDLIIVMDQFHCMARDTDIGKEQYDVLRSFNEQKLITYWIITDTDLMETCASKQYIASFFAQKFTNKLTICPLEVDCRQNILEFFLNQKKVSLVDSEKILLCEASGGIPELMAIMIDVVEAAKDENEVITLESLMDHAIHSRGCESLFRGWISGLSLNQKKLLYDVAVEENGLSKEEISVSESKMAELADEVGRGLLHVYKDGELKRWVINIPAFREFIRTSGDSFYASDDVEIEASQILPQQSDNTHVTQVFNISGNFIQNQTNNVLNIDNAITGLEDLHKLVYGNTTLLDERQAMSKLEYLPFHQDVWAEMDEEEQEEELEKYADGVFSSDVFTKGSLSNQQMTSFSLSDELLDNLSDNCRTQIICGIQVYTLIQLCIDNFGLTVGDSESPRGILFARAFERHLKDFIAPAFYRIPEFAKQHVYPTKKPFKDYPIDKTTIGTYSSIMRGGVKTLTNISTQLLNKPDYDDIWWNQLVDRLGVIGSLRNECCHSGTQFDNQKLMSLIDKVFLEKSFDDILIFGDMPAIQQKQVSNVSNSASNSKKTPTIGSAVDASLIGKTVSFKILRTGSNGNFKGIVNGKYDGSLPRVYASQMDIFKVRNTTISAVVEKIQDGRYVLRVK